MTQYTISWTNTEHQLLEIEIVLFLKKKMLLCQWVIAKNVNPYIFIFVIFQVYLRKEPDLISASSSYKSTR